MKQKILRENHTAFHTNETRQQYQKKLFIMMKETPVSHEREKEKDKSLGAISKQSSLVFMVKKKNISSW